MSDQSLRLTGHCLCRAVRYEVRGEPNWVAHCHCASCRRWTGAAVATYASFPKANVRFAGAAPTYHESSPGVRRGFCATCGGHLTYEGERWAGEIHILIGSLDDPERLVPTMHGFSRQQLSWLTLDDGLPQHGKKP